MFIPTKITAASARTEHKDDNVHHVPEKVSKNISSYLPVYSILLKWNVAFSCRQISFLDDFKF